MTRIRLTHALTLALVLLVAQSLLTGDPDTATRERLFSQMPATLKGLREDTVREQLLLREQEPARARVERLETIAALERNFAELRVRLDAVQKLPPSASAGQVWTEVIRAFDM